MNSERASEHTPEKLGWGLRVVLYCIERHLSDYQTGSCILYPVSVTYNPTHRIQKLKKLYSKKTYLGGYARVTHHD